MVFFRSFIIKIRIGAPERALSLSQNFKNIPLFKSLNILKFSEYYSTHCYFHVKISQSYLPIVFNTFFISVSSVHHYNTRLEKTSLIIFRKQGQTMAFLISD